jgi:hypothetical protein
MLNKRMRFAGNRYATRLTGVAACVLGLLTFIGIMAPPAGAVTTTVVEHVCTVIGSDSYGNQAIVCTDLLSNDYGGGYTAQVRTEVYCQDLATDLVACANITVSNETAYAGPGGTITSAVFADRCGHSSGNCPATRFYATGFEVPANLPACVAGAWGVTLSSSQGTSVELPESDKTLPLPVNYGTPHTSVGNC